MPLPSPTLQPSIILTLSQLCLHQVSKGESSLGEVHVVSLPQRCGEITYQEGSLMAHFELVGGGPYGLGKFQASFDPTLYFKKAFESIFISYNRILPNSYTQCGNGPPKIRDNFFSNKIVDLWNQSSKIMLRIRTMKQRLVKRLRKEGTRTTNSKNGIVVVHLQGLGVKALNPKKGTKVPYGKGKGTGKASKHRVPCKMVANLDWIKLSFPQLYILRWSLHPLLLWCNSISFSFTSMLFHVASIFLQIEQHVIVSSRMKT